MNALSDILHLKVRLNSLSGASLILLLFRIAGAGTGIILQIVIARYYGAEILGNFFLAFGLAAVLSIILSMGFPWIIAPVVAKSDRDSDPGYLNAFLRTAKQHLSLATALIAVPAMAVVWVLPSISIEFRWALMLGVVTAPVYAVMRLYGGLANARKYFAVANLPELMLRPLFLLALVIAAVALSWKLNSAVLVAGNLVVTIALTAWMGLMLHRRKGECYRVAESPNSIDPASSGNWRKLALPMIFATLFVNLFADLDILIIGSILPASQAGVFGVCIKITFLMAFAIQIIHQIMLRDASDAFGSGNQENLKTTITNANRFAIAITGAGLVFVIAFGPWILGVFGPEFVVGYGCMTGLMIAQLIRAAAGPAIQVLMISGNQKKSLPVYFVSLLVLFACNVLFVPSFGYLGATGAVICTTIFMVLKLNRVIKQTTGISVSIFSRRQHAG